ncbi:MAG: HEAT repeat domain-containing protein [bacterium]
MGDIQRYVQLLMDADFRMRESAVEILHHAGHLTEEVVAQLTTILETDSSEKVRRAAVEALTAANPDNFFDILVECLDDNDYIVRGRAFTAITKCLPCWREDVRVQGFIEHETHPYPLWCIGNASE